MLTEEAAVSFDDFHFVPAEFDELLAAHGTDVELRLAMPCGCWQATTGRPDPACTLCHPLGYVYDAPVTVRAFGPNRRPTRRPDAAGTAESGDAYFTLPTGVVPPVGSRLVIPVAPVHVFDILTKGKEDRIRFGKVTKIERAHYTTRTPPTGPNYVNANVPLAIGTDFTVNLTDGQITWPGGSPVPNGTRYALRLLALPEWVIWDARERVENGQLLPGQFTAKRYDYLLHPRGAAELAY